MGFAKATFTDKCILKMYHKELDVIFVNEARSEKANIILIVF